MKDYLLTLLHNCSEENFGQEAVEWAILSGHIKLTYELQADLVAIMGEPNICPHCHNLNEPGDTLKCDDCGSDLAPRKPCRYDEFCDAYRAYCRQQEAEAPAFYAAQLIESYAPLLEEILHPLPMQPGRAALPRRQLEIVTN